VGSNSSSRGTDQTDHQSSTQTSQVGTQPNADKGGAGHEHKPISKAYNPKQELQQQPRPLIIPCEQVRVWHVAYQNHFESFSKVIKGPRQGVRQSGRCPWAIVLRVGPLRIIEVLLLVAVTSSLKRVFFWSFTRLCYKNSPQADRPSAMLL
jgi:hypothetical protein